VLQTLSIARIGGFALALLALLAPAGAAAQTGAPAQAAQVSPPGGINRQSAAREKAEEGLKLFGADRWAEAFTLFKDANDLFPAPTLELYMARCQRKLGKLLEARTIYEKLVAKPPPADAATPFHEAHNAGKTELAALRERIPTLQVALKGELAPGAKLLLNGLPLDPAPARKELNPGTHTLVATAEGAEPIVRSIALAEGASEAIDLTLKPRAADRPGGSFIPAIAAFGVGAVGLGVGGVTGALVIGRASDLKARCQGNLCPLSDKAEADSARALGTVSTIAFAVGAAGVAAGVVLLVVRPKGGEGGSAGDLRARVGLGRVSLEGRF
jgi:hypothetical protein